MKIAYKLILGFFGTSLAVGGIGIISVYQVLEARSNSNSLVENPVSQAAIAWDIATALQESEVLNQKLTLARYKSALEKKAIPNQELIQIKKEVDRALRTINNRIEIAKVYAQAGYQSNPSSSPLLSTQIQLLSSVQERFKNYETLLSEFLSISDLESSKIYLEKTLNPYYKRQLLPLVEQYQEAVENQLFSTTLADNAIVGMTYQYIAAVVLSAIIVAMLLSILISYSIYKRITVLKKVAEEVGTGKLNVRVDLQGRDEFGVLAATFNKMLVDLSQITISKSYLDNILDSMLESLLVLSIDAKIKRVNQATLNLLNYQESELVGKSLFTVFVTNSQLSDQSDIKDLLNIGMAEPCEAVYLGKAGNKIPISFSASVIWDDSHNTQDIVLVARDITELKRAQAELEHSATHDPLTGLPNRSLFQSRLEHAISLTQRNSNYLYAVLFLDLDRFKVINDTFGHLAGDQLLIGIASRVQNCVRLSDTVARLGGDEFAVLLEPINALEDAIQIADRIQAEFAIPFTVVGNEVLASTSIGIASSDKGYKDLEEILRDADTAMYQSKQKGRASYTIFEHNLA